jgi:diguanylate cyclase (GGDEF)-like protein/PAS domain S-box-containing protein
MVRAAAARTGSRISIYTPVPQLPQASASPLTLAATSLEGAMRQDLLLVGAGQNRKVDGWTTFYERLPGQDASQAVIAIGVPDLAFTSIRSSISDALLIALLASLVVAVLIAVVIGRVVTRPLLSLSRAVGAIMSGQPQPQLEVKGTDEVAVVARAFNEMSARVAKRVQDLSREIQDLSRELGDLSLVGETLSQSEDVFEALKPVAERVRELTRSELCAALLDAPGLTGPIIVAGDGGGSIQALEEVSRWVVDHAEPLTTNDLQRHPALTERTSRQTRVTSVMAMPVIRHGHAVGAVLVGCQALRRYSYDTAAILSTVASQAAMALANAAAYENLENGYLQTVTALAAALEAKDEYTAEHAGSIGTMAAAVGRSLGLRGARLRQLQYAAVLHDVGKIGVRKDVLEKPGALTPLERLEIERHTSIGERIVQRIEYLRPLAPIIRSAHERWDGRGYPDGLAGERIRLESRIIFACDAYHAMTSDRSYRPSLTRAQARRQIEVNSGSQFDPAVAAAFLALLDGGGFSAEPRHLPELRARREGAAPPVPVAPGELREALAGMVYEHLCLGLAVVDDAGILVDANPAFWRLAGHEPSDVLGRCFLDVVDEQDRESFNDVGRSLLSGRETAVEALIRLASSSGETRVCLVRASLSSSAPGLARYLVASVADVTNQHRSEQELRRLADEDHLTRLLNRRAFCALAEARLLQAVRAGHSAALVYLDVDGLKAVNDRQGHAAGDETLILVAEALLAVFRDADVIARIGGDEFAVLMDDTDSEGAAGALARLGVKLRDLASCASPASRVAVSSGLAVFDPAEPCSLAELLMVADRQMYESKWAGRLQVSVISELRGS